METKRTEGPAVSPFPSAAGQIASQAVLEPGTRSRIESTTSDAYMDMHFGRRDEAWPDGAPFVHASAAISRQRDAWGRIVREHQRELAANGVDSRDRKLMTSLRRARAELGQAGSMVAIALEELGDELRKIDGELSRLPPAPPEAAEIRRYIASMPDATARERFIMTAIESGDGETVASAIGAKHFLSGITPEQAQRLRERWQRTAMPEMVERRAQVVRARQTVEQARLSLEQHVAERIEAQLSSQARSALAAEQQAA
jgi:hypothetical protein